MNAREIDWEELQMFQFQGKPIHPAIVRELITDLADPLPVIAAIDLEGASRSNRYSQMSFSDRDGMFQYQDETTLGKNAFFAYGHLGLAPNGTHVLLVMDSGGGSGIFEHLLFIKFESDQVYDPDGYRERIIMNCVGNYGLGDRYNGKLRLQGHEIFIGRSHNSPVNETSEDVILKIP